LYRNEDDIPKHIKKRASSKSKSSMKSKHKHTYEDCIFIYDDVPFVHVGKYCTICGKISNDVSAMIREVLLREYDELPDDMKQYRVFLIKSYFDKFVDLMEGNE
jgi:hypothetical protein